MSDCLFCKIASGEVSSDIVYQDDRVVVFKDIHPKAQVHLLMIPRLHLASLNEVAASHSELMTHMLLLLPKLAQAQGLTDGFRTVINTGPAGGQVIFHLHMHLLGGKQLPGFV